MDLFNKKKLKEQKQWLDDIISDRNHWQEAYVKSVKDINNLLDENKNLSKSNGNLIEENQKLIDWIEKILNEVGVKLVDNYVGQIITIPYYEKETTYKSIDDYKQQERKDVIVPSIRFTKSKYKE